MAGTAFARQLVGVSLVLSMVACGGTGSAGTGSPTSDGAPAGVLAGCTPAGATPLTVTGPRGAPLHGVTVGTGALAVVLSYESEGSPCDWVGVAREVAARGHRAVLWEYGGGGGLQRVDELAAVVSAARRGGARSIVLAGGSLGGCVSLIGGSRIRPPVSGVAVLSCAVWYDVEARLPTTPWARRLTVPTFYAVGGQDDAELVQGVRTDYAAVPSPDKSLLVLPGSSAHGVELLAGPAGAEIRSRLFALLDRVD
jgi:hypothetical protein